MRRTLNVMRSCVIKFWRDQTGSMTIEFVIWLPMLVALFMFFVYYSQFLTRHTLILNQMHQVARAYSAGFFLDTDVAKAALDKYLSRAADEASHPLLNSTVTDENGFVTIDVVLPMLDTTGFFRFFADKENGMLTTRLTVRSPIEGRS